MLRSLEIRNYRNLRHLTIEKLGRVNLLVGKNNTGKTSVLEAVYLWANNGRYDNIYELIEARAGNLESTSEDRYQQNRLTLASMFSDRKLLLLNDNPIVIEGTGRNNSTSLTLGFQEGYTGNEGPHIMLFGIKSSNLDRTLSFPLHQTIDPKDLDFLPYDWPVGSKNQFIRWSDLNSANIGILFDEIAVTDQAEEVVEALRIIDSRIAKLGFRTNKASGIRYPIVRFNNDKDPLPLRSMGDGINRILTIILAMVNCENGYLLIDEFENGLHYSVQEKLWEIIFYLAERLNIQVFATTHSSDAIRSFTSVLAKQETPGDAGKAIRLQLHNDMVRAVDYSPEELETAAEYNIEVR